MEKRSIISNFHDFFTFAVPEQEVQGLHHSLNNRRYGKSDEKFKTETTRFSSSLLHFPCFQKRLPNALFYYPSNA